MYVHSRGRFLLAVLKSGGGTAARMVFGVLTTKILAVALGPSGIGLWALVKQTRETLVRFGALGGQTAVTQALASREGHAREHYVASASILFLSGTIVISLVLLAFGKPLASLLIGRTDEEAVTLVRFLTVSVGIGILQLFLFGILNGNRAIGRLAIANTLAAGVNAGLAWFVAPLVAEGHVLALVLLVTAGQFVSVCWSIHVAKRMGWLAALLQWPGWSQFRTDASHFLRMGGALLVAGQALTFGMLAVRIVILHGQGASSVGFFDAAWTINATYVMLVLSSFATYFVPTMAASRDAPDRARQINDAIRLLIAFILPLIIFLLCFKDYVIIILYSNEFQESARLLRWTLIGDCIRILCWPLSGPMIASGHAGRFALIEATFTGVFLSGGGCLAVWLYGDYEIFGPVYILSMLSYAIVAAKYCRKFHGWSVRSSAFAGWTIGFGLVVVTAGVSWSTTPSLPISIVAVVAGLSLGAWVNKITPLQAYNLLRKTIL